ncbi:SDR family NAD(P)-dependent oxidoreductase [Thioclava sp. 15-R06ZXC-3]|uniref:SDR family NAD(P)-dependent oxidoreductase n=1 Tax=Thioclava arctica TaxID=3238301 RepID=A0ABV3TIW8_9RHOB
MTDQALVIGDTGGIGAAIRSELEARGAVVTGLSRSRDGFDVSDEDSIASALGALSGPFDLIFVASGQLGTPEKTLSQLGAQEMAAQFAVNAMGPALVLKHARRLLPRDRPARFAALSARVGSIGDNRLGGWYSYRAAKSALNQLIHGASVELARSHPQLVLVCLHPGTVDTPFTANYPRGKLTPAEAARRLLDVLEGLSPTQTGGFYDYAGKEIPW